MKQFSSSIILLLFSTSLFSQTDNSKSHYLKIPTVVAPVDITHLYTKDGFVKGNSTTLDTIKTIQEIQMQELDSLPSVKKIVITDTVFKIPLTIEKGYAYNIIQEIGTYTIIKFWPIADNEGVGLLQSLKPNSENDVQGLTNNLDTLRYLKIDGLKVKTKNDSFDVFDLSKSFYLVKTSVLKNNSVEFENKKGLFNIGLLVLPVKIRPFATEGGQFDFTAGFSAGAVFSWTVHHNWKTNFTHNFLMYAGISSYTADSSKIKEQREDYKIATFSPAIGWMLEKNNVQLSILTGLDFPSGNLQQKWVYKNQPWVGFGVGIGLFKIDNDKNTANQGNK